jgi:hypothetical protein
MNTVPDSSTLDERYGRTAGARRRRVLVGALAAAAVLIACVAWVIWVGLFTPGSALETRDIGFELVDDPADVGAVDIRFEVSTDPGNEVSCALQALDDKFAIVGWKIVELPPAEQRTRQFTERVETAQDAVTGLIYRCWLT